MPTPMERINAEIAKLENQIKDIADQYQTYAKEVAGEVERILKDANVWEDIHALETERLQTQQKAQAKVNDLQATIAEKAKVRNYLREMEDAEVAAAAVPAPVVEAPAAEEHDPAGCVPRDEAEAAPASDEVAVPAVEEVKKRVILPPSF